MRKIILPVFLLISLLGWKGRAEPPAAVEPGYTVTVEFYVDPAGAVTQAKVVASELEALNGFALAVVEAGQILPNPLPPQGSPPKRIQAPVFFPVESYEGGKPLPIGVVMPTTRLRFSPLYPFELWKNKTTGGAWLAITIGKDGMVKSCKTIKESHPGFGSAAEQAVNKWVFIPAKLNDQPVEVTLNVGLSFELAGMNHSWRWLAAPPPSLPPFIVTANGH